MGSAPGAWRAGAQRGALSNPRFHVEALAPIRFTALSASGEISGAFLPGPLLAAMSACSKNIACECA